MILQFIMFCIFTYFILDDFSYYGIYAVPGSIQINIIHLVRYWLSLIWTKKTTQGKHTLTRNYEKGYTTIYGYCCRQLFNTFIINIKNNQKYRNKDINIGVTPIHHTSFRNIIENNFPQKNIHIFDIDEKYENIIIQDDKKNIEYDIIVVTHLWGKYLNINDITKQYKNALIIEDVVLAGKFKKEFNNNSDLLFHSCGMDKRPSSIFGGYVHIKNENQNIIENMITSINNLELPTKKEIFKKIYDTTLLYLLYNIRFIQNITKLLIYSSGYKLSDIIQKIRKNKPGFEHSNYMKCPTHLMIKIIDSIYDTQNKTEELFIRKNKLFLSQFSKNNQNKYFPWNSNNINSCLPYNVIYIEQIHHEKFINFFDSANICTIKNPTYKTFNHSDKKIKKFLNNIFYLPNLYNLNDDEIINIATFLNTIIV